MASTRVIGLDIGTTAVRAAQVEFGSGGPAGKSVPTLIKVGQVPLPLGVVRDGEVTDQSVVSQAIKQLWSQTKLDGKDVVIGIGNQRVVVRDLDLPWMPLAAIKGSLPYQVQDSLPMQASEALLDYFPTGEYEAETGRTVRGMLVAAQRETVSANVMAVEGAGLRPTVVDLNAFALLRSLARGDLAQRTVALVDIGARLTNVVIASAGMPMLVRILRAGGQDVTDAVGTALQVTAAEAEVAKREIGIGYAVTPQMAAASEVISTVTRTLLESIRNTFSYYGGNHPGAGVEVVVLTGGGSHLPGLGQYLASASRLPVTLGDPFAGMKTAKGSGREAFAGLESVLALPVGLAYGVAA